LFFGSVLFTLHVVLRSLGEDKIISSFLTNIINTVENIQVFSGDGWKNPKLLTDIFLRT